MSALKEGLTKEEIMEKKLFEIAEESETNVKGYKKEKKAVQKLKEEPPSVTRDTELAIREKNLKERGKEVEEGVTNLHIGAKKVADRTGSTTTEVLENLQTSYDEKQTNEILELLKFAQSVDVCFVYDATGSMGAHFRTLNSNIRKFIEEIKTQNRQMELRLSMVVYRDPEDGAGHIQVYEFNSSLSSFERYIRDIRVGGGGDECEDVIGALKAAKSLQWKNANKLLFLCGDAPCHGRQYYQNANDNHPGGLGIPSEPILHEMIEKRIQVVFWKANESTNKMIQVFNEEASRYPGQGLLPVEKDRNEYISTDALDTTNILESMRRSLSKSLSSSLSHSSSRHSSLTKKSISDSVKLAHGKSFRPTLPTHDEESSSKSRSSESGEGGKKSSASPPSIDGTSVSSNGERF